MTLRFATLCAGLAFLAACGGKPAAGSLDISTAIGKTEAIFDVTGMT